MRTGLDPGTTAMMHRGLDIGCTDDVDTASLRGMISHRGAVAMAKAASRYSEAPEIRKRAGKILAAPDAEIARMRAFLKRREAE